MYSAIYRLLIITVFLATFPITLYADQNKNEPEERIINGEPAPEMISTVGITYKDNNGRKFICTGVIINPGIVLTAGHCSCGIKSSYKLTFHRKIRENIQKIPGTPITYEGYNCARADYVQRGRDFAIIKFDHHAPKVSYKIAKIIRLTEAREHSNQKLTVVGYGLTEPNKFGKRRRGERRKAEIPVLSWFCWEDWAISRGCDDFTEFLLSDFGTTGSVADDQNRDSCGGDSGGPAFTRFKNGNIYLVGIVSRGMHLKKRHSKIKCGGGGIYEVVARDKILKWLKKKGAEITLSHFRRKQKLPFKINIILNDDKPNRISKISSGYSEKPVSFSWSTHYEKSENKYQNETIQYRYRLIPIDLNENEINKKGSENWSNWSKDTSADYYFLSVGKHAFEVQTRYQKIEGEYSFGDISRYSFFLKKPFVSPPNKEQFQKSAKNIGVKAVKKNIPPKNIYTKSQAFLVGVTNYNDPKLKPLPYINRDLDAVQGQLQQLEFDVERLPIDAMRDTIITRLGNFTKKIKKGDRVILYFSMHGFEDEDVNGRAYIAAKDCQLDIPDGKCISLSLLKRTVEKIQKRGAKHTTIILDTCSSGLGILEKSSKKKYFEQEVALAEGAHIITAGLANQEALIDLEDLKMSFFTHFLVKGLKGEADITKDGIISMSELLVYVRGKVAKLSDSKQTPMMGRLEGSGEMVFIIK